MLDHSFLLSNYVIVVNPWLISPVKPDEPLWQLWGKHAGAYFTNPNEFIIHIFLKYISF